MILKKHLIPILLLFFLFSCSGKTDNVISYIPEASGICYNNGNNSLYVANDEGSVYNIDLNGKILNKRFIGKYDLEGISCSSGIKLISEKTNTLLVIDEKTLEILDEKDLKLGKTSGNKGVEGVIEYNEELFFVVQSNKNNLLKVKLKDGKVDKIRKYDIDLDDLSGITEYNGFLYIISDKSDLLLKYDIDSKKVISKERLIGVNQEGITFDDNGFMYIADDSGKIIKQKATE